MLMKWITCRVAAERREAFSRAQAKWDAIRSAPGLVGQLGGWDRRHADTACILAVWRDSDSYDRFMAEVHDRVAGASGQASTYESMQVRFFSSEMKMPGRLGDLAQAIPGGRFLRVAECRVAESRVEHFFEAQKRVWIPAMAESEGMLGGYFSADTTAGDRFLVVTLWDSDDSHARYASTQVPHLRQQADVSSDLDDIVGRFVELEPAWRVLPFR